MSIPARRGQQKRSTSPSGHRGSDQARVVAWVPLADGEGLSAALRDCGYGVVPVETFEELLDVAERTEPDIVVVGNDGSCNLIWLVAQITALSSQTAVVVMFERPDDVQLLAVIHAGAAGYVPTTIPPERLCAAIEAILAGDPVVPRSMTALLVRQIRSPGCIILPSGHRQGFELSAREWDVLCLLQQGRTTNEIAEHMFVGSATVRSHVSAIVRKLGALDRESALDAVFSDRA